MIKWFGSSIALHALVAGALSVAGFSSLAQMHKKPPPALDAKSAAIRDSTLVASLTHAQAMANDLIRERNRMRYYLKDREKEIAQLSPHLLDSLLRCASAMQREIHDVGHKAAERLRESKTQWQTADSAFARSDYPGAVAAANNALRSEEVATTGAPCMRQNIDSLVDQLSSIADALQWFRGDSLKNFPAVLRNNQKSARRTLDSLIGRLQIKAEDNRKLGQALENSAGSPPLIFNWTFAFLRCLASSQHFHVDDSNLIYDFSKPLIIVNILLCNIKTFLSKEYKICLSVYC